MEEDNGRLVFFGRGGFLHEGFGLGPFGWWLGGLDRWREASASFLFFFQVEGSVFGGGGKGCSVPGVVVSF